MKIAFLVWRFPVLSEPFILNQITGLLDCGHEVDIYACSVDQKPLVDTAKVHSAVTEYRLLERTYYAPRRPSNSFLRWLKGYSVLLANFWRNTKAGWELLQFTKYGTSLKILYRAIPMLRQGGDYDIIHCQFGTLGNVGLLLRQAGVIQGKLITTFRGIDISKYVRDGNQSFYQRLFQEGDFFLANCEFFRQRAISLGCPEQKILVHGSGIDCNKFTFYPRHWPEDGVIRLATTGRLVEKKGIEYCISAMPSAVRAATIATLAETYPNLEYNIIGDGPLKKKLQQLIEELNVGQIVKILGWQQQQEIVSILHHCHIFLATSVTAEDGNQDAPVNTLKEAMAMGLPVISTYHGGIPELVEDGVSGFLVPEKDTQAIATKLTYLIEHPEIWEAMGKAGRASVEAKYDMNQLNRELVTIYQSLLSTSATWNVAANSELGTKRLSEKLL